MQLHDRAEDLDAFRRGDKAALTALYHAHVHQVMALARHGFTFTSQGKTLRFCGFDEPSTLQEVVQSAFLKAFSAPARQRYDGQRPYLPYLLTIAKNHFMDEVRRAKTEAKYIVSIDALHDPHHAPRLVEPGSTLARDDQQADSPERQATTRQLQQSLARFLDGLDEADAALVQLHLLGGCSQDEIAAHLGESRNDVRRRIKLLRLRLLRHLKAQGFIAHLEPSEVFQSVLATLLPW